MLQHYFHQSYQFRAKRRNLKQFKMNTNKTKSSDFKQKFVCMSNGNAIEIYKITSQSVDFYMRKQFFCNIVKLQVIPSLHHDSDYIFILDDLGRFSFWRPSQGQKQTCNVIQKQNTNKRFYRQQLSPQEQQEFSGCSFKYDVKDTVGHIFFTVQNKITILSVSVKLKQGLKINGSRTYQIPYTRFRFVNCLNIPGAKDSQVFIGIIQQLEQKTILKIHTLNLQVSSTLIDEESLSYKIQKINLLSFQSGQNDQIIVLTYDQISLYKFKQTQYLCNYRTRGNYGSICYISPASYKGSHDATYIHLGYDMTVFTKSRLHSYGPLKIDGKKLLENRGILESKYLGHVSGSEIMIGFVTNFNQVYFVLLYENKWKLIRQIQSLSSIFSIHELNKQQNDTSMIVVHASQQSSSQITHVQITSPTILDQEQVIQNKLIETIDLVQDGQSLIISSQGRGALLSWQDKTKKWVQHFSFNNMKQQILACTGIHVIMTSGIYKYEVNQSNELTMNHLIKEQNILSAVANKQYAGYYTSQGSYKYYEFQSNQITRIRKNCIEEYIWYMLSGQNVLVSAAYNEPGQLRILPLQKVAKKVKLQTQQLVSSIGSISYLNENKKDNKMVDQSSQEGLMTDLIIGFHNGDVQVFSLDQQKTIAKFNLGAGMVNITNYRSTHVIVYTSSQQYILSRTTPLTSNNKKISTTQIKNMSPVVQYKMHQVQFSDNSQQISKLVYLPKFDKFIALLWNDSSKSDSIIQLRSLKLHKNLSDHELTLQLKSSISMKTLFKAQNGEQIPFVQVYDNQYVYIALPQNIYKYSIKTRELVKKQLHLLKQIVGVQKIKSGIVVTGVDVMQSGSVVLFDYQDLSIKGTYNLGRSKPSCIKSFKQQKYSNRFLIQHQSYITLFETEPTHLIIALKTINTKNLSSTIDINQKYNKLLITDQYRYLSVWDYDLQIVSQDFIPVSKYFGAYVINDCCWLDGAVVTGDRGGNLAVMEFNLGNPNDLHKMNMTKVAQIYVGQQIFTLKKLQDKQQYSQTQKNKQHEIQQQEARRKGLYYGTSSGSVGMIKTISQQEFKLLKQIQLDTISYIDIKQHFSYQQWRKRIPKDDKLIDSNIIKYYLDQFRNKIKIAQQDFYNQVEALYNNLIGGIHSNNITFKSGNLTEKKETYISSKNKI